MKKNWLENGLNDKLGDYGSPIDLEEAWKALEQQRKPEKKKRRFLGWWFFGLIFFIGMGGYFLMEKNNALSSISDSDINANIPVAFNNTNNNVNQKSSHDKNLLVDNNVLNNKTLSEKTKHLHISKSDEIENKKAIKTKPANVQHSITHPQEQLIIQSTVSNQSRDVSINNEQRLSDNNFIVEPKTIASILQLPLVNTLLLNSFESVSLLEKCEALQKVKIKKSKSFYPKYISIASGYSPFSKGKILEEETSLDAISANLLYHKYLSKNLYLSTGISFDQFTNRIETIDIQNYTELDNHLIKTNEYLNGIVEETYGMVEVAVMEKTTFEVFNKYKFVSIPLILGLELSPSGKSSFQIEGGMSASILNQIDGKILATNSTEIFNDLNSLDLKKRGIVSGLFGMQWNYIPVKNKDWRLFLKYQGYFQLNKLSDAPDLNISQFNAHQFSMGIKYELF